MNTEPNISIYVTSHEPYADPCKETIRAFRDRGLRVNVVWVNVDDLKQLIADGFKSLPVVKLTRQARGWEGHRPEEI